jgi:hypothetical protein
VRARQPRVKRKKGRFQREGDAEEEERRRAETPGLREEDAERLEVHRVGLRVHEHERGDQHEQSDVGRHQVVEPGEPYFLISIIPYDH